LDRRMVYIKDLPQAGYKFARASWFAKEGFCDYFGLPLIAKGELLGVLEIFHRTALATDSEWLDLLEALADQAAISIDNAQLFSDLQRTNIELEMAYNTTLEGWSAALDLRDKETEGHTQRVTEITVHLARSAGLSEEEILHVRRGALLHDIGKMGIPDVVLMKPDPLSEAEWVIMRKHPVYAYELLYAIKYLHLAIDIPYCHHEKWDGSGYPRGLKREHIPLAARIFAVVDVWDALTSDRPYRIAMPHEKALKEIRAGSGHHFDPHIVELFMRYLKDKK
jgi:putative nucleotidyltransferase with HDIG domain